MAGDLAIVHTMRRIDTLLLINVQNRKQIESDFTLFSSNHVSGENL